MQIVLKLQKYRHRHICVVSPEVSVLFVDQGTTLRQKGPYFRWRMRGHLYAIAINLQHALVQHRWFTIVREPYHSFPRDLRFQGLAWEGGGWPCITSIPMSIVLETIYQHRLNLITKQIFSTFICDWRLLRVRAGKAPDIIMNHVTLGVISFLFVVRLAISEEDINRVRFLVKMHHIF
jgi:hypothetical protein